jgi:hypothetical protein
VDDYTSMGMLPPGGQTGNLARLVREAARHPPALVPAVPLRPEDFEARYRQRFAYTSPTPEQIGEWSRMLRRHRPDGQEPPGCLACRDAPYPCHFNVNARAALTAAAAASRDSRGIHAHVLSRQDLA